MERSFGYAEEAVQRGADRGGASSDRSVDVAGQGDAFGSPWPNNHKLTVWFEGSLGPGTTIGYSPMRGLTLARGDRMQEPDRDSRYRAGLGNGAGFLAHCFREGWFPLPPVTAPARAEEDPARAVVPLEGDPQRLKPIGKTCASSQKGKRRTRASASTGSLRSISRDSFWRDRWSGIWPPHTA